MDNDEREKLNKYLHVEVMGRCGHEWDEGRQVRGGPRYTCLKCGDEDRKKQSDDHGMEKKGREATRWTTTNERS